MIEVALDEPSKRQRSIAIAVVVTLVATTLFVVPFASTRLPNVAPFLTIYLCVAVISDLITAFLLVNHARITRSRSILTLALAYFFAAAMIVPHVLTFPGIFSETGLFGAVPSTSGYLWAFWRGGFPLFVIVAVVWHRLEPKAVASRAPLGWTTILASVVAVVVFVVAISVATLAAKGTLPTIVRANDLTLVVTTGIGPAILGLLVLALAALLIETRVRSVVHLWVAVTLLAATCDFALTLVAGERFTAGWYLARVESVVASMLMLLTYLGIFASIFERVARISNLDGLTGIPNRRAFDDVWRARDPLVRAGKEATSLLMLDIDLFKKFNDRYGHQRGDDALRAVAQALQTALPRRGDFVARYGGEEFVAILPETDSAGARRAAERIRSAVMGLGVEHAASSVGVLTISIGVATAIPGHQMESLDTLLRRADDALYEAKAHGGNAVTLATATATAPPSGGHAVAP